MKKTAIVKCPECGWRWKATETKKRRGVLYRWEHYCPRCGAWGLENVLSRWARFVAELKTGWA